LRKNVPIDHDYPVSQIVGTLVSVHITKLSNRYASELGENAYAVFNAVTEFASNPPANGCVHRERHSLQKLAGAWLSQFSRQCREPGFDLMKYLAGMPNGQPKAGDTAVN
jgi:hypothetical protein